MRRMSVSSSRCSSGWRADGKLQIDGIGDAAETLFDRAGDLAVRSASGEDAHDVVGHFRRHRVPAPFHRHPMQLQPEILQSVQRQDRQVGPRRAIEPDAPPCALHARCNGRLVGAGNDEAAAMHVEMRATATGAAHAFQQVAAGILLPDSAREHSGCSRTPSATWPATRSIASPTAAMVTGTIGRPVGSGEKSGVIRESL